MENGDYNVYSDDWETFKCEAGGMNARHALDLPEVEEAASAGTNDNQTPSSILEMYKPSSILEMYKPSSILEMDLGASTANVSTATAAFNDDGSNLDMFGHDENLKTKMSIVVCQYWRFRFATWASPSGHSGNLRSR